MTIKRFFQPFWLPSLIGVGIAVLGLVGSGLLGLRQEQATTELEKVRLVHAANVMTQALQGRIDAYAEIAFGLRGLFIVNPELPRNESPAPTRPSGKPCCCHVPLPPTAGPAPATTARC